MKIFVISLQDQAERRAAVAEQLAGLDFEFFDAVRGSDDLSGHFAATSNWQYRLNTRRDPLPNEVGCYASHLGMWKKCAELGEPLVIMEDDFVITDKFHEAVAIACDLIDRYGFIRFEAFKRDPRLARASQGAHRVLDSGGFELYYLADPPLCLTAYAVNPVAAGKLAEASRELIGPVDKFMQRTWHHEVPLFALSPPTVGVSVQADVTTIGDRSTKSHNPLLLLSRLIYKSAGQLRRNRFNARQFDALGISPRGD